MEGYHRTREIGATVSVDRRASIAEKQVFLNEQNVLGSLGTFARDEPGDALGMLFVSGAIVAAGIFWLRSLEPTYHVYLASARRASWPQLAGSVARRSGDECDHEIETAGLPTTVGEALDSIERKKPELRLTGADRTL